MKLFLQIGENLRIINEPLEWSGTLDQFLLLEPLYPGLPVGATVRYHSPDLRYYEDSAGRHLEETSYLCYCENVQSYIGAGCVYVYVLPGTFTLDILDVNAFVDITAHIKASADPNDPDLSITHSWIIRPWHESGDRDALLVDFVNGAASVVYRYHTGLALGDWFLREEDFDQIEINGQRYCTRLVQPVKFTLFRHD